MKIKSLIISASLIATIACSSDDNGLPEITSLLSLTVDASYLDEEADESEDWIIVHSEKGSLLAFENFEANQQLEITTKKSVSGKIMVTHLRYSLVNGTKWYQAKSYANIEKGKSMVLKGLDQRPESTGKINVSVNNLNDFEFGLLSSRVTTPVDVSWNSTEVSLQANTYTGISKHIATISDGNSIKYKVLNNVQPGDSYSFSFNDMDPVDQKITFTFPPSDGVLINLYGSEPDATLTPNAYWIQFQYFYNQNIASVDAGYLNHLTNYKTVLNIYYPDYSYQFTNLGSIPNSQIEWPQKSDFNITKNSFTNFSATSTKAYVWRISGWGYNDVSNKISVNWSISSTSGQQVIKELPSTLINAHPALSPDKLQYGGTTFYIQSPPFESFVSKDFGTASEPAGLQLGINLLH